VRQYVELEHEDGERFIAQTGRIAWLASFAPIGLAEVRAFVADTASTTDLDERLHSEAATDRSPERIAELARGFFSQRP
jgi:hypothetical protein